MLQSASYKSNVSGVDGIVLRNVLPKRDRLWIFYPHLLSLNLVLLGAIVCNVTNGFDNSMLNGLQIIPAWQEYFDNPKGGRLGLIANAARIGQIASLPIISPLLHKFGRRIPIAIGSSILLVGVAIQASAQNYSMFVIGRVLLGFGNNIQECTCPILISELAYPSQRATVTGRK